MTRDEIRLRLQQVLRQVFDDDQLVLTDATAAIDIPGWDSMMHVTLMIAVEDEFGVSFNTNETRRLQNVGAMIDAVAAKMGN